MAIQALQELVYLDHVVTMAFLGNLSKNNSLIAKVTYLSISNLNEEIVIDCLE